MQKKRILSAFLGSTVYTILIILMDRSSEPEDFAKENYWIRPVLSGIIMFIFFLLFDKFKDVKWSDFFNKFKK